MPTTVTDRMSHPTPTRVAPSHCTCADCGGLECLCRPRFFAGQLLTEEELNRLDHYIVAKNKLQNRYIHGWGVVCGLDVVCDDCTNGVIVKPGYALSPCGDDIVVCREKAVDVCSLIQVCTKRERDDCDDLGYTDDRRTAAGCVETGDWVLAIRYTERASRGVTPLRGGGCTCGGGKSGDCGCGCGGKSSSGGCGCGGKSNGHSNGHSNGYSNGHSNGHSHGNGGCGCNGGSSATSTSRFSTAARCTPLLECEPTVVCEEYQFEMYRLPLRQERGKGAMQKRFEDCVADLIAAVPPAPGAGSTNQEQHDWCCRSRDGLLDYIATHSVYDCSLAKRVRDIDCPSVNLPSGQFTTAITNARTEFFWIELSLLVACICSALMPPCPDEVTNARVPLAVVTMSGTGSACRVVSICNWTTERKYATTFPSLQYWLSILPFGRILREALEQICCHTFDKVRGVRMSAASGAAGPTAAGVGFTASASTAAPSAMGSEPVREAVPTPASSFHASEATIADSQNFMRMAFDALANRGHSVDGETLLRGALGDLNDDGSEPLPPEAKDNLLAFFALDQMVKPTLRATMPRDGGLGSVLGMMAAFGGAGMAGAADPRGLADEVASLRATVDRQNRAIEDLRSRMENR